MRFIATSALLLASALIVAGCKFAPATTAVPLSTSAAQSPAAFPPRPTVAPAAFRLFHKTDSSLTLVTDEHVTDDQLASLLWQLHDAARAHSFNTIGLPQTIVDARNPIIWFHIYRGSKCASEKYTTGKLPCGASYHAAADYTLGGFTNHDHDDGVLIRDEEHETHLW